MPRTPIGEFPRLLTPAEVADILQRDVKTVTRWAAAGRLPSIRTLGGHRRYLEDDVRNLAAEMKR